MNEVGTKRGSEVHRGTENPEGDKIGGHQEGVCGRDEMGTKRGSEGGM